jgi:hypothetical protein
MGTMSSVHTHEVAILKDDKETVGMIRIQKGTKVCPLGTEALLMAMVVRPCVTDGEKLFESGSSRCRRSSARGTQLAAQLLRFIQDVILKKCRAALHAQVDAIELLGALPAGHNGPGRAATGRQAQITEKPKGEKRVSLS